MKTVNKVLDFCNEFAFNDQHNIKKVVNLNPVREFIINVLSGIDFKHDNNRVTVMVIKDDMSLKIIVGHVKNIEYRIIFLRITILHILCLEKLYNEEKDNETRRNLIIDEEERIRDDQIESSEN